MGNLVPDPTAGLYSSTDATKGPVLLDKFNDGLGQIVTGAAPVDNLTQLLQDGAPGVANRSAPNMKSPTQTLKSKRNTHEGLRSAR